MIAIEEDYLLVYHLHKPQNNMQSLFYAAVSNTELDFTQSTSFEYTRHLCGNPLDVILPVSFDR